MDPDISPKILLVEDDAIFAGSLAKGLVEEGFDVRHAVDVPGARRCLAEIEPDLIVLDLGLPRIDGLSFLGEVRASTRRRAVLILSARGEVEDRVKGLELGADDYLSKPFAFTELIARMRSVLRRSKGPEAELRVGGLCLNFLERTVRFNGIPVDATEREFLLLLFLARHQGLVVSRDTLAREVCGIRSAAVPYDNVIDVNLSRLRAKLADAGAANLILTVRGLGYQLAGVA